MLLQLPSDELILEDLSDVGRDLGANIADRIERHRKTVARRLRQLDDYGAVEEIGRGVYEITPKGEVMLEHIDEYGVEDVDFDELVERELAERQSD
jgi:Mn-dependent DtxR family transcriptional regulator